MPRFYEGKEWRFVVTTLAGSTLTFLDRRATQRNITYRLGASAVHIGTVPSDDPEINLEHTDGDPFLAEGSRLIYGFRRDGTTPDFWTCRYGGKILQVEDDLSGDRPVTRYTAFDPWQQLFNRPVRGGSPDYLVAGANGVSFTDTNWNVVIATLLKNTIAADGTVHLDAGTAYGGTSFYAGTLETVDAGGFDVNFPQGMSVGEAWARIAGLGVCDIVLTAIYDPLNRPGYTHELNVFVRAGADRRNAIFRVGDNIGAIRRLEDGTQRANRIYAYKGDNRDVTAASPHEDIESANKYGVYVDHLFYPESQEIEANALALWQLALRRAGKTVLELTPVPERAPLPLEEYDLGDRVPVWATAAQLRKPIAGELVRIYGIPLDIGDDALETVRGLLLTTETPGAGGGGGSLTVTLNATNHASTTQRQRRQANYQLSPPTVLSE